MAFLFDLVEDYLYRPLARPVLWLVREAKRLQSGRLDAYLVHMLIALVAPWSRCRRDSSPRPWYLATR